MEDNPGDIRLIEEYLKKDKRKNFFLKVANSIDKAISFAQENFSIVLLDLNLGDSYGIGTFKKIKRYFPQIPIVVLTGLDDEEMANKAVQGGAQDYLFKSTLTASLLKRSIQYAISRHRLLAKIRELSLIDELTGLYNRRGFFTLFKQQLKILKRARKGLLLFFIDLDNMKKINDTFGHREGDRALVSVASSLKEVFRASDILARLGGDEFGVLAIEAEEVSKESMICRLRENIKERNRRGNYPYFLSVSIGTTFCSSDKPLNIDELLSAADKNMYREKKQKQKEFHTF